MTLDPPFNSSRNYNVLFRNERGEESAAQITAFEDTWHWNAAAQATYEQLVTGAPPRVGEMIEALRRFVGTNQMMAYLVMMAARLVELHRVLKPTGSLYLHCDPTASHYLKIILDTIFGPDRMLAEVIWKRTSAHSAAKRPAAVHDVLLLYAKSDSYTWHQQYQPYDADYIATFFEHQDADGRRWKRTDLTGAGTRNGETGKPWHGINVTAKGRHWAVPPAELDRLETAGRIHWPARADGMPRLKQYLDDMPGVPLQDVWTDIPPMHNLAQERLGYPTQKPLALLERIIAASSNAGDLVLDPFAGCGTAIAAAQKLGRAWIGIDVTHLAIALLKYRLRDTFGEAAQYRVVGEPEDLDAARQLASEDRYQFQWWALSLVEAKPLGGEEGSRAGKKGADRGVDGVITFLEEGGRAGRVLVQVKSGHVGSPTIRDLVGTITNEKAAIGVLLTLEEPTPPMRTAAATAGSYTSPGWGRTYPRIQILTIAELLRGATIQMPPAHGTFAQAPRATSPPAAQQGTLELK